MDSATDHLPPIHHRQEDHHATLQNNQIHRVDPQKNRYATDHAHTAARHPHPATDQGHQEDRQSVRQSAQVLGAHRRLPLRSAGQSLQHVVYVLVCYLEKQILQAPVIYCHNK